jgi:hypothetical protein
VDKPASRRRAGLAEALANRIAHLRLQPESDYKLALRLRKSDLAQAIQPMDPLIDEFCMVRRELQGDA